MALKFIMLREVRHEGEATEARARLIREAQALAQLAHPHVVAIYDVGTFDGDVFIAMEYVEGQTLRAWTSSGARSVSEVLSAFLAAGEGLAAAHGCGLVHRDFKPDNVMLGVDGRIRVLDFGLARVEGGAAVTAEPAQELKLSPGPEQVSLLETPLTQLGVVMGTPAYMAPEQFRGEAAGALADEFSFCVALYEALYGERPFTGGALETLRDNVRTGNVRPPPRNTRVPSWLRRVVLRGLAPDPADRYESLSALLTALRNDPWTRARRVSRWGGVVLLAVLLGLGLARTLDRARPCEGAALKLVGVWDGATRAAVEDAFTQAAGPAAKSSFEWTVRALDRYAEAWTTMWTEACEATRVRGEQSEALLDLRMNCLRRRRQKLEALAQVLTRATPSVIPKAAEAALGLPPLDLCADERWLSSPVVLPESAEARAAFDSWRARLDVVEALTSAGQLKQALEALTPLLSDAQSLASAAALGEATFTEARIRSDMGEAQRAAELLQQGLDHAAAAGDLQTQAKAWAALLFVKGYRLREYEEVEAIARAALGFVRLSHDEELLVRLGSSLGVIATVRGEHGEAERHFQEALDRAIRLRGEAHPLVALVETNLGALYMETARYDKAIAMQQRAVDTWARAYGPTYPKLTVVLSNLAATLLRLGRPAEAKAKTLQAIAIREQIGNPSDTEMALLQNNLGKIHLELRELEQAERAIWKAHELWSGSFGARDERVAIATNNLALLRIKQGRVAEAITLAEQALSITDASAQDGVGINAAAGKHEAAKIFLAAGQPRRALSLAEKALGLRMDPKSGAAAPTIQESATLVASCWLRLGEPRRAKEVLTAHLPALASSSDSKGPRSSPALAGLYFELAKARWGVGERQPAREAAQLALQGYADPHAGDTDRRRVQEWLNAHASP